ncbi:MAG: hypothetical protein QXZ70_07005 [Candidatus Bathyarchaeia archaeon]
MDKRLKEIADRAFYYAGTYLGKIKRGRFFPSFSFLAMLVEGKSNKVVVDDKSAWLFVCGRDVFRRGVLRVNSMLRKGDYTLVINGYGECLGFGRILSGLNGAVNSDEVVVKNVSDVGDFLRREI